MTRKSLSRVVAPLLAAAGIALPALVSAQPVTFYACQKDGKVIPGTIQVGSKPNCNGGAKLTWWDQGGHHHHHVVSGAVSSDGRKIAGEGFEVVKPLNTVGQYKLIIAPGMHTGTGEPQVTVTPYGYLTSVSNPLVMGVIKQANGSWVVDVWMSQDTPSLSLSDQAFMFVLVQK
ncbi:MAG: hypothetical protein JNL87_17300 [Burkholderiaceae bacterium]|nr:hypothetical protein [Burkholderiaceae bacterium]